MGRKKFSGLNNSTTLPNSQGQTATAAAPPSIPPWHPHFTHRREDILSWLNNSSVPLYLHLLRRYNYFAYGREKLSGLNNSTTPPNLQGQTATAAAPRQSPPRRYNHFTHGRKRMLFTGSPPERVLHGAASAAAAAEAAGSPSGWPKAHNGTPAGCPGRHPAQKTE